MRRTEYRRFTRRIALEAKAHAYLADLYAHIGAIPVAAGEDREEEINRLARQEVAHRDVEQIDS